MTHLFRQKMMKYKNTFIFKNNTIQKLSFIAMNRHFKVKMKAWIRL